MSEYRIGTLIRCIKINGHKIEEYDSEGTCLVYVDDKLYAGVTYEFAMRVCAQTMKNLEWMA